MGQPQSINSATVTYSTSGTCTKYAGVTAATCGGVWAAMTKTCSEWVPTANSWECTGTWRAVAGQTQPPFTVVATAAPPATTADPSCACKSGEGCAQSTCKSCVVSKVCTKVFPTKDECLTLTTNGKWCGN